MFFIFPFRGKSWESLVGKSIVTYEMSLVWMFSCMSNTPRVVSESRLVLMPNVLSLKLYPCVCINISVTLNLKVNKRAAECDMRLSIIVGVQHIGINS